MADDLVINVGANVGNAVSDLKKVGNGVRDLKTGMDQANKELKRMNWGAIGSSLAIGLQDAASVLSNGGSFGMALNAAGNNLIQLASMVNPIAGSLVAVGIAAVQMAPLLGLAGNNMAKLKEEAEGVGKAVQLWGMIGPEAFKFGEGVVEEQANLERRKKAIDEALKPYRDAESSLEMIRIEIEQGFTTQTPELERKMRELEAKANDPRKQALEDARKENERRLAAAKAAVEVTAPQRAEDAEDARAEAHDAAVRKIHANGLAEMAKEQEKAKEEEIARLKEVEKAREAEWAAAKKLYEQEQNEIAKLAEQKRAEDERRMKNSASTGRLAGGFSRGSSEEVSLVNRIAAESRQNANLEQIAKQQLEQQKKQTTALEKTNANLERGLNVEVVA